MLTLEVVWFLVSAIHMREVTREHSISVWFPPLDKGDSLGSLMNSS